MQLLERRMIAATDMRENDDVYAGWVRRWLRGGSTLSVMTYPCYDWRQAIRDERMVPVITLVGILPHAIAAHITLPTTERRVLIHRNTIRHIHDRRGTNPERAALALRGLPEVVTTPEYAGCLVEATGRTSMICIRTIDPQREPILVAVKWIPAVRAATAADELFVSTAYPAHLRYLQKLIAQGIVRGVAGG